MGVRVEQTKSPPGNFALRNKLGVTAMEGYATSLQHLLAELERIDLLLTVEVGRARSIACD